MGSAHERRIFQRALERFIAAFIKESADKSIDPRTQILHHPLLWGAVALSSLAVTFSPKVSSVATWICLALAWVCLTIMLRTVTYRGKQIRSIAAFAVSLLGAAPILFLLGAWLSPHFDVQIILSTLGLLSTHGTVLIVRLDPAEDVTVRVIGRPLPDIRPSGATLVVMNNGGTVDHNSYVKFTSPSLMRNVRFDDPERIKQLGRRSSIPLSNILLELTIPELLPGEARDVMVDFDMTNGKWTAYLRSDNFSSGETVEFVWPGSTTATRDKRVGIVRDGFGIVGLNMPANLPSSCRACHL